MKGRCGKGKIFSALKPAKSLGYHALGFASKLCGEEKEKKLDHAHVRMTLLFNAQCLLPAHKLFRCYCNEGKASLYYNAGLHATHIAIHEDPRYDRNTAQLVPTASVVL